MKNWSRKKADEFRHLTALIARMPDKPPPADLTYRVMQCIAPKRPTFWGWLRVRISSPFAIIGMRPLPATATAVLLAGLIFAFKAFGPLPATHQPIAAAVSSGDRTVNFTLDWPVAEKVAVIGSFNGWRPEHYFMHRNPSDGNWELTVRLQPGRYAYAFLIDDKQIIADPRSLWELDDGFGTRNSIITIEDRNSHENRV